MIVGDLNAMHIAWDKMTNDRGTMIKELVKNTPRTHIVAADRPTFQKI